MLVEQPVLHLIPVLIRGGAELQLCSLAEDQAAHGQPVVVACLTICAELRDRLERNGVSVVAARSEPVRFVRSLLQTNRRAGIFHVWMYHGFVLALLARPFTQSAHVWSVRRTEPTSPGIGGLTRLVIRVGRTFARRGSDEIIYCSVAAQDADRRFGYPECSGIVVYNSVDVGGDHHERHTRDATRPARIGFLGRWNPDKGVDLLLAAWGSDPDSIPDDAQLTLAGPGLTAANTELAQDIERFCPSRRPELVGPVHDPAAFLSDSTVSSRRREPRVFPRRRRSDGARGASDRHTRWRHARSGGRVWRAR